MDQAHYTSPGVLATVRTWPQQDAIRPLPLWTDRENCRRDFNYLAYAPDLDGTPMETFWLQYPPLHLSFCYGMLQLEKNHKLMLESEMG